MPDTVFGVKDMKMRKTQSQPSNASDLREAGGEGPDRHRQGPDLSHSGL